jgi:hypothetical protein
MRVDAGHVIGKMHNTKNKVITRHAGAVRILPSGHLIIARRVFVIMVVAEILYGWSGDGGEDLLEGRGRHGTEEFDLKSPGCLALEMR